MKELEGLERIVFEKSFSEMPDQLYTLTGHSLWLMEQESNQIRIISFDWNKDFKITEGVSSERILKLPEGIEVKQTAYCSDKWRRQLA